MRSESPPDSSRLTLNGKPEKAMTAISRILRALSDGEAGLLPKDKVDQAVLSDSAVQVALRRSAERVVFHRPNYRSAIQGAVDLGVPCDIWTAARAGLLTHVQGHIAADGSLIDAQDEEGRTPLARAALIYGVCKECEEVADFLLRSGAKVDVFTASTFCMPDVVRSELERAPEIASQRCEGSTPLNWAVRPRRNHDASPEICELLIAAGADVHDPDKHESDMTPLHHAAEWGPKVCLQLVDLLIAAGADVNAKDAQGWTALDYATDRGRAEMIEHLSGIS